MAKPAAATPTPMPACALVDSPDFSVLALALSLGAVCAVEIVRDVGTGAEDVAGVGTWATVSS